MTRKTNPNDFLSSAPEELVTLLSKIYKGKDILRRLLTDSRMKRSWTLIGKRCSRAQGYLKLWNEIVYTLGKSRKPEPSRAKTRDGFLKIAEAAEKLATTITNGLLDRLTYEFFPADEAQLAFKVEHWSALGPDERYHVAHQNLAYWPAMTGLLEEFARYAEMCAEEAFTEKRTVDRETYDRQLNVFVRRLASYFRKHLGGPMEGTLANIASVVFDRQIDKKLVKQALPHEKGGA